MNGRLTLSVAPMMERTDRHFRYLMRLVAPKARLYTEMITSEALINGDSRRLLAFDVSEHPVAAQLGGADPGRLACAAKLVAVSGYDEVNLNVGCPSDRVQAGEFGARLMREPERVADCVVAMREASGLPVTVKTRIGVDEDDDYGFLRRLTERVVAAGASTLIVHARKAWLSGLSPKQNREIPPLDYARVHRLKHDFPVLPVVINGGFADEAEVLAQAGRVDGVMLGRAAYHDPLLVGRLDARLTANDEQSIAAPPSLADLLERYVAYMRAEQDNGTPLRAMSRHLFGLYANRPGARRWRRCLADFANTGASADRLPALLTAMPTGTRYNAASGAAAGSRQQGVPAAFRQQAR
jgi:tRNA-dihydrouridine synthase A